VKRPPENANIIALPSEKINDDFPFAQPALKFVEISFQEGEEHFRLAGHGYDGHVIRVEG
jgi:hypothetical protein